MIHGCPIILFVLCRNRWTYLCVYPTDRIFMSHLFEEKCTSDKTVQFFNCTDDRGRAKFFNWDSKRKRIENMKGLNLKINCFQNQITYKMKKF